MKKYNLEVYYMTEELLPVIESVETDWEGDVSSPTYLADRDFELLNILIKLPQYSDKTGITIRIKKVEDL